ncbi:hypothetical protein [Clostridium novyi]|uniref:Uncharacterized protein n=1 Tax=Clostridium novyi (strain NT) TaxID=386415 RepID=A0PXJ1_CLONN|nr:hypothetical protein [Clostridium novyi]ABK61572.1 conserved hypothetical protein [Clostridium novyi NT]KEH87172.1 hypothetical protein Z966_00945 [Clostridium novyi A str. NCTC 538]
MNKDKTVKIKNSVDKNMKLSSHFSKYIGQTVTIFVTTGGGGGLGFTGVVLSVNRCFLRLITRVGSAPECPVGNGCSFPVKNDYKTVCNNLGTITDIPIDKIVAFTHNVL